MGIVRAIQKGDVPASKFSKAAQKAAKSMSKGSVKKYAATKHDDLPKKVKEMYESVLNENPAVIATAARMAVQNAQGKKVSVNTARQSSYASKDPSAHKKAKSIFQRIKDKFSKKKDDKPKKQSAPTTAADFRRRRRGESLDEKKGDPEIISKLRDVLKKGYSSVKDPVSGRTMKVDSYTASAITQVYDKINRANKKKFADLSLLKMQKLAMKFVK